MVSPMQVYSSELDSGGGSVTPVRRLPSMVSTVRQTTASAAFHSLSLM